ncbi:MAG: hypothetical protein HQL58_02325 [Magnetococcales bacterium]|nr:hypothetical protein [Magnetococcales bacterium]
MNGTTVEEIWALFRENAQQIKETSQQMKETDQSLKRLKMELEEQGRRTDARIAETNAQLGRLGNRLGEFVEEMVKPASFRLFQTEGIQIYAVYPNISSKVPGATMEIDVLAEGHHEVVAIEAKSKVDEEDIVRHVYRLQRFRKAFPRYADCIVYGAIAGMVISDDMKQLAIDQGLFVIVPSGDSVVLVNESGFKPKAWQQED